MGAPKIDGVSPSDAARVQSLLADMAPTAVPDRIAFVPPKDYANFARQLERGRLGNRAVGAGAGSDERYGAAHTIVGKGFSAVNSGQTWLSADLLKNPKALAETLAHELGHYHAAAVGGDASEDTANRQRNIYLQRAQQAQKIDAGVSALPTNAHAILGGVMKALQAPQILAGKQ